MIDVNLNGDTTQFSKEQSLEDILAELTDLPSHYAVAVNKQFIPKSSYSNTKIEAGDEIELVMPMQGG